MDDIAVLTETLNQTLQRHGRLAQAYEVEIANLTVEVIRLRARVEELEGAADKNEAPAKPTPAKS